MGSVGCLGRLSEVLGAWRVQLPREIAIWGLEGRFQDGESEKSALAVHCIVLFARSGRIVDELELAMICMGRA